MHLNVRPALAAGLLAATLAVSGCSHGLHSQGWAALIDGDKGLENFERVGDANWRAESGAIVADNSGKEGGYLVSRDSYRDVEVYAEFWVTPDTNSGIFVRLRDRRNISPDTGYEVNIWDARPDPAYGTGAIVAFATVNPMPKAGGKWNQMRIIAQRDELTVELNGEVTAHRRDATFASGPIAVQHWGGTVKLRKLEIRPL